MARRRKIVYVDGAGRKHRLHAIKLDLSSGRIDDKVVEDYLDAAHDDDIIRPKASEIRRYLHQTENKDRLERYYEFGGMLQFIDEISTNTKDLRQVLKRLFVDLNADPKIKKTVAEHRLHRYAERAYMLAKLPPELVFQPGLTWSHWFDILEYPHIFQNRQVLEDLARRCSKEGWASGKTGKLRAELQRINTELQLAAG